MIQDLIEIYKFIGFFFVVCGNHSKACAKCLIFNISQSFFALFLFSGSVSILSSLVSHIRSSLVQWLAKANDFTLDSTEMKTRSKNEQDKWAAEKRQKKGSHNHNWNHSISNQSIESLLKTHCTPIDTQYRIGIDAFGLKALDQQLSLVVCVMSVRCIQVCAPCALYGISRSSRE